MKVLEKNIIFADDTEDYQPGERISSELVNGYRQNAMQTNPTLHQTVGWHDLGRNADGLFDPLSDTLPE